MVGQPVWVDVHAARQNASRLGDRAPVWPEQAVGHECTPKFPLRCDGVCSSRSEAFGNPVGHCGVHLLAPGLPPCRYMATFPMRSVILTNGTNNESKNTDDSHISSGISEMAASNALTCKIAGNPEHCLPRHARNNHKVEQGTHLLGRYGGVLVKTLCSCVARNPDT